MSAAQRVGADVAARITDAMQHAGLHRQALAARAGISRETMARKLERKPETFTLQELCALADALEVTFEQLVGSALVAP